MEQVNILNKMAEYDFSAPINVTMIFDDSDDDSKPIIDDSSCKNTHTVDLIEIETVTTNLEAQYLEVTRDNNNKVEEDKRAKRDFINYYKVNNNNNLQPNPCLTGASRKRKCKDPEDVYSVEAIVNNYEKLISANQQKNSEIKTKNPEESTYMCQQTSQYKEVGNYVNNSLVKLSENLILIMDAYYQMLTQLRTIKDESIQVKSKNAFSYIHRYFLSSSYEVLNSLVLPQENNTKFINSFLDNTVKIAMSENGIKCNRQHIYAFYNNMVKWAKVQKERMNKLRQQDSANTNQRNPTYTNRQNPTYASQQIPTYANQQHPTYASQQIPAYASQQNPTYANQQNHTHANQQNPTYTTQQNHTHANQRKRTQSNQRNRTRANTCLKQYLNKPPMQLNIPAHANAPNANQSTDNSCIFSSGPPGRQITIRRFQTGDTFQTQACNSLQKDNEYYNNFTPVNGIPLTNTNLDCFEYNNPPNQIVSANHCQARSSNLSQNLYHPTVPRAPPPPYSIRQQNYNENTNYYLQPIATQLQKQNQVDTTRSTESIESGYVSPSHGSPNMNQMDGVQTEKQTPFTPVISNIVSLSPRISYTSAHGCHLCGKLTDLWCPVCHTYYCSTFCEELDSQFHKAVGRQCSGGAKQNTK